MRAVDGATQEYPTHLECDAVVADGGVVHVRPLRTGDRDRLRDLIAGVSDQSAYFRYFSRRRPLRPEELERFVTLDYRTRLALGVEVDGELIATGQYDTDPESGRVEVAFLVRDDHQGRGIGTLLLDHLAAEARRQGVRSFHAETLGQNRQMLRVFSHAGLPIGRDLDHGVWEIEMRLDAGPNPVEEQHEHRADVASVRPFLAPASVVVVVGPGYEALGERLATVAREAGVGTGPPVAPEAVAPGAAELAVIAVPPSWLEDVIDRCGEAGIRAALVLSPGPADGGQSVRERARGHGLRLLGPGSAGLVAAHPAALLPLTTSAATVGPGRVALLAQSGNLGAAILRAAEELQLGVAAFVSFGEKLDVSSNDVLQFLEDDDDTAVLCLYLHSFGNPRKFGRIARRLAARKPVVVVRSGRQGARAVDGTGFTDEEAADALFRQTGLVRVDSIEEMLDVARLLADQPLPAGPRVGVVGNGSGLVAMTADACAGAGLELPAVVGPAADGTRRRAEGAGVLSNPVDLGEGAALGELTRAASLVLASGDVDALLVCWAPADDDEARAVAAAVAGLEGADRPVLLAMPGGRIASRVPDAAGGAVPVFGFPEHPAAALGHAVRYARWRRAEVAAVVAAGTVAGGRAAAVLAAVREGGVDRWLQPGEVGDLLTAYGIEVVAWSGSGAGTGSGADPDGRRGVLRCRVEVGSVPGWGQVVALGLTDRLAGLTRRAHRLTPFRAADAERLVDESPAGPLLASGPAGGREALVALVEGVGRLAEDVPELLSLTLDPVLVAPPDGGTRPSAIVGEAQARLAPHAPPSVSIRRLR